VEIEHRKSRCAALWLNGDRRYPAKVGRGGVFTPTSCAALAGARHGVWSHGVARKVLDERLQLF